MSEREDRIVYVCHCVPDPVVDPTSGSYDLRIWCEFDAQQGTVCPMCRQPVQAINIDRLLRAEAENVRLRSFVGEMAYGAVASPQDFMTWKKTAKQALGAGDGWMTDRCPRCGGEDFWFDRTLLPPCFAMHYVCSTCGWVEPCFGDNCRGDDDE
jgi:predicted RNA-binding Zn-ribbon protein involved in translation (DUF1610 family)